MTDPRPNPLIPPHPAAQSGITLMRPNSTVHYVIPTRGGQPLPQGAPPPRAGTIRHRAHFRKQDPQPQEGND